MAMRQVTFTTPASRETWKYQRGVLYYNNTAIPIKGIDQLQEGQRRYYQELIDTQFDTKVAIITVIIDSAPIDGSLYQSGEVAIQEAMTAVLARLVYTTLPVYDVHVDDDEYTIRVRDQTIDMPHTGSEMGRFIADLNALLN